MTLFFRVKRDLWQSCPLWPRNRLMYHPFPEQDQALQEQLKKGFPTEDSDSHVSGIWKPFSRGHTFPCPFFTPPAHNLLSEMFAPVLPFGKIKPSAVNRPRWFSEWLGRRQCSCHLCEAKWLFANVIYRLVFPEGREEVKNTRLKKSRSKLNYSSWLHSQLPLVLRHLEWARQLKSYITPKIS